MIEIERKFLIRTLPTDKQGVESFTIKQGYLNSDAARTVRIRIKNDQAYITVKGKSNEAGTTRLEWEKEIDLKEAESLLLLCEDFTIDKTRHVIPAGHHFYEVDVFHGDNQGLVIAEIELNDEDEIFEKPNWLGEEVTGQLQYYNSNLSKNPFKNW